MNNFSNRFIQFALICLGALLYLPFLGKVHLFDWYEINLAESAREMLVTRDYLTIQLNFHPTFQVQPFFVWLQAISMNFFGVNEFAARLPNALCGIITLLIVFRIGKRLIDPRFGITWAFLYAASFLPFMYGKSGIADTWYDLFMFLGIYFVYEFFLTSLARKKNHFILLSGLFVGLAVLTKGPMAIVIFLVTLLGYFAIKMFRLKVNFSHILLFIVVLLIIGASWDLIQLVKGNFAGLRQIVAYKYHTLSNRAAINGNFFLYHFIVLFFGVFPASIFAIRGLRYQRKDDREPVHEFKNWMLLLFSVVLFVFTIAKAKIIYYSSLCYFPLTFMGAYVISRLQKQNLFPSWIKFLILSISIIWGLFFVVFQLVIINKLNFAGSTLSHYQWISKVINSNAHGSFVGLITGLLFVGLISLLVLPKNITASLRINSVIFLVLIFNYVQLYIYAPVVEQITQGPMISFYLQKKTENCYVSSLGIRGFAHLFYTNRQLPSNIQSLQNRWLLTGDIDKPAYFVFKKANGEKILSQYPDLEVTGSDSEYVYAYRRVLDSQ